MKRLISALCLIAVVAGVASVLSLWLPTVWARLAYPFDLEWMEGGMLVHALRSREGLGLYVPPGADFIPYIYPPLFPWLIGILGEPSYALGRGLSLFCTLASCAALVVAVRQEKAPWFFALGAVGVFLSTYEDSGSFFDLVRPDALALALAAWSLVLCRRGCRRSVVAGAGLLFLAFVAKHNYAALGLVIFPWLWRYRSRRRAFDFVLCSAAPALLFLAIAQWRTGDLFLTYLLEVPAFHPLVGDRAFPGTPRELFSALNFFCVGTGIALLTLLFRRHRPAEGGVYWLGATLVILPLSALMRAHHGGFLNVLMPAHWLLSCVGCMALGSAVGKFSTPGIRGFLSLAAAGLLAFQCMDGRWVEGRFSPRDGDVEAGEQLLERIASFPGEVWMPQSPWYPVLVGKAPSLHLIALWDIDHRGGPLRDRVGVVREAMSQHRWDAIIVAPPKGRRRAQGLGFGVGRFYERAEDLDLQFGLGTFGTRAGWRVRPTQVWVPQETEARE